jgi:hypothetical protein
VSLGARTILDVLQSHALASGLFERVNGHEPKNAPGNGLTAAVWGQRIDPVLTSGLASSSARLTVQVRVYGNMLAEPLDGIDPNLIEAVDTLMEAYSGDFQLGGAAREIDLLGEHGIALTAIAGYLTQDGRLYRVYDLTVPVIVNDAWTQSP